MLSASRIDNGFCSIEIATQRRVSAYECQVYLTFPHHNNMVLKAFKVDYWSFESYCTAGTVICKLSSHLVWLQDYILLSLMCILMLARVQFLAFISDTVCPGQVTILSERIHHKGEACQGTRWYFACRSFWFRTFCCKRERHGTTEPVPLDREDCTYMTYTTRQHIICTLLALLGHTTSGPVSGMSQITLLFKFGSAGLTASDR